MKNILLFIGLMFVLSLPAAGRLIGSSPAVPIVAQVNDGPFLSVQAKDISGVVNAAAISWPDQVTGASWQGASQCLEISYHTVGAVSMLIYTNNISTGPCLGVTFSTATNTCVPVGWIASNSPLTPLNFGEPGGTNVLNSVVTTTATVNVTWRRLQDVNDGTWATKVGLLSGTAPVMYSAEGLQLSSSANIVPKVYVYFEGNFSYANAGDTYATTIYVDLISQ
jgi:hypothetical protein